MLKRIPVPRFCDVTIEIINLEKFGMNDRDMIAFQIIIDIDLPVTFKIIGISFVKVEVFNIRTSIAFSNTSQKLIEREFRRFEGDEKKSFPFRKGDRN